MNISKLIKPLLFLSCLLLLTPAWAVENIGKVIVSVGKVQAVNSEGVQRKLKRRSPIYQGETLVTSVKSRLQVRFSDGSMLALKANSQFTIENYQYEPGANDGKAVYNLIKGGMQKITGAIGSKEKQNYKMKTPIATIGIRGTHFSLQLCQGDCKPVDGKPPADGLYGGVTTGQINVANKASSTDIGKDQYFHMPNQNTPPEIGLTPPEVLTSQDPNQPAEGENEGSGEGGEQPKGDPNQPPPGDDPNQGQDDGGDQPPPDGGAQTPGTSGSTTDPVGDVLNPDYSVTDEFIQPTSELFTPRGQQAPNGVFTGVSFITLDGGPGVDAHKIITGPNEKVYIDNIGGVGNVPVYLEVYDNGGECNPCQWIVADSATLVETGGNPSGVNWGRWVGDSKVADSNGIYDVAGDNFHYIYSDKVWQANGYTGTAFFDLSNSGSGATSPTDQFGNTYTLSSASANVNFGSNTMNMQFVINGGGNTYSAMNANPGLSVTEALDNGVELTQSTGISLTGEATIQFIGTNTSPDGMASSYAISADDGNELSGVMYLEESGM